MANKHYTGTNTPQIKQLYPEWLYPDWMPWWEYREYKTAKFNELQEEEEKASAHRQKLERDQQAERHRAFEENARKHNIPIPKKKKEPWED